MRKQQTMLGLALLVGCWSIQSPASAQEYRGTAEQQMACTPDVWRLCSDQVPNVSGIVACLQHHASRLSPGCRIALATSPPAVPNGRIARLPYAQPPYAMHPSAPPAPYYGVPPPYYAPSPYYEGDDY